MNISITNTSFLRVGIKRVIGLGAIVSVSAVLLAQARPPLVEADDISGWTMFTSRAGWNIKYPPDLHISSCRQCEDPAAPDVAVVFSKPSGQVVVRIEPLADKDEGLSTRGWLNEVEHDTALSPILSEQEGFVDGAPALIVVNGALGFDRTENIYISHGKKTFAVRFPHTEDSGICSICQHMLSTFRFSTK
jgi:hypothetical protein